MLMRAGQVSGSTSALTCSGLSSVVTAAAHSISSLVSPGAQMEVDYTEKLNFSDDEENQAAKEKRDNW